MPRLEGSEWFGAAGALALLLSLFALPWFAFSIGGHIAPGSDGDAFRWLGGEDVWLLLAALAGLAATAVRYFGQPPVRPANAAVATAAAGLVAAILCLAVVISPPDGGRDLFGPVGGDPGAGLTPRSGPVIGLFAAAVMFAAGVFTVIQDRGPAAQQRQSRRARHAQRLRAERSARAERQRSSARRRPAPRIESRETRPRADKPVTRVPPEPAAPPEPETPRLPTATVEDLVEIGFSERQAERIVDYREQGLVTKVAHLKRVPGIARPVLDALSKRLVD